MCIEENLGKRLRETELCLIYIWLFKKLSQEFYCGGMFMNESSKKKLIISLNAEYYKIEILLFYLVEVGKSF